MKKLKSGIFLLLFSAGMLAQTTNRAPNIPFQNTWTRAPGQVPADGTIDSPLMGNGDVTMTVGYRQDLLRYYLSKNDFWRLLSKADLSGPRVVGYVDIKISGLNSEDFSAEQPISNGVTTCTLKKGNARLKARSWVAATGNLVFLELEAFGAPVQITFQLNAPENKQAALKTGKVNDVAWLARAFEDSVDIPTEVAVAIKSIGKNNGSAALEPGQKLTIALAIESKFKTPDPLSYVLNKIEEINAQTLEITRQEHNKWWKNYWDKSSITIEDSVLMRSYYQGLYTMAACSRDPAFPPGLFGWTTTDSPSWNGDYHLNYNFQAPFYGLFSANRLEQGEPQDAPLMDFMPRGEWYAQKVTNTRGILYPVGIGPIGIEPTRGFRVGGYQKEGDIEQEGLFYGQRSNAVYGLVNMAQHWRCTYDTNYGAKIYPYALAVVNFWEDYLRFENGRYVIYGDAIHEGSGKDKNPILSLGLLRNALELMLDLSLALKKDENRRPVWSEVLNNLSELPVQTRNGRKLFRYTEEGVDWWNDNGLGIQHIYPGNAIHPDSKDEWKAIARNTIDEMQRWQDMNTSSSFFVAAIRVGYDASILLHQLHKYALHTHPNGFQLNNPHGIENSCTVANALNEMLCMSVDNTIRLFPGFPGNSSQRFSNIRAWGAFLVSAQMKKGIVSGVEIFSERGRPCRIVNPWPGKKLQLLRNGKKAEIVEGNRISFPTSVNERIALRSI